MTIVKPWPWCRLSPREAEVMQCCIDGMSSKETGRELGLSHRTVEIYRHTAKEKLKARNILHAALILDRALPKRGCTCQQPSLTSLDLYAEINIYNK